MSLVQPNIIAEALGITSNALRKRRVSGNNKDNLDYIVTSSGRALYKYDSIPPDVRVIVDKITIRRKRQAHDDRMKNDFRYANSLGKYNARRKALIQKEIDKKAKELLEEQKIAKMKLNENRSGSRDNWKENNYVKWVDARTPGNYWKSYSDYEKSKKNISKIKILKYLLVCLCMVECYLKRQCMVY